ncbi:MAG: ATP-binding protein [Ferruginibacter sp.]
MQTITGEIRIVLAVTLLLLLITTFVILFIFSYQKRYYLYKKKTQALETQFSQTLLQSQIEIQEQTLQHIGRELHDNLSQVASIIKINLTTIQLTDTQKAKEKINDTKELTKQLIMDIKSLSVSLGSDRISQVGLAKAIQTEVERLNKTGEFTATYEIIGAMPEIDNDKALILYRMVQEVLNNIVKHSQARQIKIVLNILEEKLILEIQDDGIGFNTEEKTNAPGAGLRNLQTRALLINAQLQIQSSPESGTKIIIGLPL